MVQLALMADSRKGVMLFEWNGQHNDKIHNL